MRVTAEQRHNINRMCALYVLQWKGACTAHDVAIYSEAPVLGVVIALQDLVREGKIFQIDEFYFTPPNLIRQLRAW